MRGATLPVRWLQCGLLALAASLVGCAGGPTAVRERTDTSLGRAGVAPALTNAISAERGADVVIAALNFIDAPYLVGGNDAQRGFDCSGFTRHLVHLSFGIVLPRRAQDQAAATVLVDVSAAMLQPGDLVFFNTLDRSYSHVGLYAGNGRFIHAPREGAAVRLEDMRSAYWARRFDGARRVAIGDGAPPAPS